MIYTLPNYRKFRIAVMVLLLLVSFSCREDNDPAPAAGSDNSINTWILENMQYWYYWNTQLPAKPDKNTDPESFFKSLLSSEDRFSWIQDNYQELLNSLQGVSKESGYEFVLYKESESSNNVIAQILYTKPNSPAESAGLKRGDVITHVNGQQMTTSNYRSLLESMKTNHSITYKPIVVGEDRFDAEKTTSLQPIEYSENPNYMSKVIDLGGRKVGYYVYNFFSLGVDGGEEYEAGMQSVFTDLKAKGITDLVLDLRFNSGGSESAAQSLASYIAKDVDETTVFSRRQYNSGVEKDILSDPKYGESFLRTEFQTKAANVGSMLTGGRVYVLTSSRTASASELVINALKPFMDVFLIGDVTYGKNVGSISLYDDEDPNNKWGVQPIVVKVFNSLNQSDYGNGFQPNVLDEDNSLYLYPLGDQREALLSQAIGQITGASTNGRRKSVEGIREAIGNSIDLQRRSFNLVIDRNLPELAQ